MNINLEILEKYYNDDLLYKQRHPTYELLIWNYTPTTQFERRWDDITLQCRGLVTDFNGNVVSWCLKKFFNMEELSDDMIPKESFDIFDKMDGSYISIFMYNDEIIINSRGSFNSDASNLAYQVFKNKYKNKVNIDSNITYILELIGPDNRIVVSYPENDLVLLCALDKTGKELDIYTDMFDGFNRVKKHNGITDFIKLKNIISNDEEGYVVRFKSGFRMKIKGQEYLRLHNILSKFSSRTIWQHLKDNTPLDEFLKDVPDEFYNWIEEQRESLNEMFKIIKANAFFIYYTSVRDDMSRKEVAEIINSKHKDIRAMLFNIHNGKDIDNLIWDKLYPKYTKPFINTKLEE